MEKLSSHTEYLIAFGIRVKEARNKLKLTQKEFAEMVGVSHEWLCKIENGKVNTISLELLHRIKDELKINE